MESVLHDALRRVTEGQDLDEGQAEILFADIMAGRVTPLLVAALLAALKTKGEAASEIVGAARAMRRAAHAMRPDTERLVDTCGTGGDHSGSFNISTAAAVLAAAAGARVAKHGNRAASSRCGSADVLESLGVAIDLGPAQATSCLDRCGITFLFAPVYHPAMRHAILARRELRLRTIFNYLGPLTNPAGVRRQVIGVADPRIFERLASVLGRLEYDHCVLVHGLEGLDEVSLAGPTRVAEWRSGALRERFVHPEDFGLASRTVAELRGGDARMNAAALRAALSGRGARGASSDGEGDDAYVSAAAQVVALNAGCALYVAGVESSWESGVRLALAAIADGRGERKLDEWISVSSELRGAAGSAGGSAPAEPATDQQPSHT